MKKKEGKEKDNKQKIDYHELINKNLHDFKLTFDYSGYQYTRLDLSVHLYPFSLNPLISCHHSSKISSTLNTLIFPIIPSLISPIVSVWLFSINTT